MLRGMMMMTGSHPVCCMWMGVEELVQLLGIWVVHAVKFNCWSVCVCVERGRGEESGIESISTEEGNRWQSDWRHPFP